MWDLKQRVYTLMKMDGKNVTISAHGYEDIILEKHFKLTRENPIMNYKIKVTPETSAEVQELFFELGCKWHSGSKVVLHTNMPYLFVYKKTITFVFSDESFVESAHQEITLPQLRDIVVLNKNNVEDATHKDKDDKLYYESSNLELYIYTPREVWEMCDGKYIIIDLKRIDGMNDEINWEEALQHFLAGRYVEMLDSHNQWEDMKEFYLHDIATNGNQFRLKPKTIYIESGNYTKEQFNTLLEKFND